MSGMITIVVANQKGGVGKTATVVHLSTYLARMGKRVVVFDFDKQGNCSYTLSTYGTKVASAYSCLFGENFSLPADDVNFALYSHDNRLGEITNTKEERERAGKVCRRVLELLSESGFDYCIVDTPPTDDTRMVAPLYSADYVLLPIQPEMFSMMGVEGMVQEIMNIRAEINPDLKVLGILPTKVKGTSPAHKANLAILRQQHGEIVFRDIVPDRTAIETSLGLAKAVWDLPNKTSAEREAAKEMRTAIVGIIQALEK